MKCRRSLSSMMIVVASNIYTFVFCLAWLAFMREVTVSST
jgi:hypothetical protein